VSKALITTVAVDTSIPATRVTNSLDDTSMITTSILVSRVGDTRIHCWQTRHAVHKLTDQAMIHVTVH